MPESEVPEVSRDEVADRLTVVVTKLNRLIRPSTDELSHGVLSALSSVKNNGPLRPSELARLESVAAPTMTRIIADLENRGLVERQSDELDGRSFLLQATEAGVAAIAVARKSRAERVLTLFAGESDENFALIAAALPSLEKVATTPRAE